jgi:mannose-6-phosphate isomerase-like protein (cupin superfamily)
VPVSARRRHDAVVVAPGGGRRIGNVEVLALSGDTPRFNLSVITMAPGRHGPRPHVHDNEDDAFYVLEGEITFLLGNEEIPAPAESFVLVPPGVRHTFVNHGTAPARMLNIHAPAGFDRRLLGDPPVGGD